MSVINVDAFKALYPELEPLAKRLQVLKNNQNLPQVVVFGKFNHGKSTLLNALLGQPVFAASDARQTIANQTHVDQQRQIVWVDTPGLDADIVGADDQHAYEGAMVQADIILLVHNLNTGELDQHEVSHFSKMLSAQDGLHQKAVLVITQIDQVSEEQKEQALRIIKGQLPSIKIHLVSAVRYQKGMAENKKPLVERSGIPELLQSLEALKAETTQVRLNETKQLSQKIRETLHQERQALAEQIASLKAKQQHMQADFDQDLTKYFNLFTA